MSLEIEIKSNSKQAEASLKRLLATIDALPTSVQKSNQIITSFSKDVSSDLKTINKNVEETGKSVQKTVRNLGSFAKVAGGLITGLLAAGGISSLSSQFTELNNRIALTTGRTQQLLVQQQKLFAVSRRSNVNLQTTVNLYSSLVVNAQRSRKEATILTEVLIKAGKIGGGSAETIASSLIQLQQGLASGTLRGEELNSVLEGTPRIAQAIAKELGTTTGQLRKLAAEGKISGDAVARALINAKDDIEAEFATLKIPFNQIIANSGREIGISLNKLFGTVGDTFNTIFGEGDIIKDLTKSITNGIDNLAVFIRIIQTDLLLLKLEFGSLQNFVVSKFKGMVDGVTSYSGKLFGALDKVKDFAKSVGSIFYDLFIEVVGNSTWPDLVDGVNNYADNLTKTTKKVGQFADKAGGIFSTLRDNIKEMFDSLVFPSADKFKSFLNKAQSGIRNFVNKVTSFSVLGIIGALSVAFGAAFTLATLGGGFAGGLGAKIGTAFLGAVSAYFMGIVDMFSVSSASETGPIDEILRTQVNILLTIASGISAIVNNAASVAPFELLESAMRFVGDNLIAVAAALPILASTLKTVAAAGGSSLLNPLGSLTLGVGATLGDSLQSRMAGPAVRGLETEGKLLEAELSGLKESIRGQRLRLGSELAQLANQPARTKAINQQLASLKKQEQSETAVLIQRIKKNQQQLQIGSQLLTGPVNRLRDTMSKAIVGFGRLGGMIGGTVGGFLGAGIAAEKAKEFGLNSGETMIAVLIAAQLGQLIVGAMAAGLFQLFAALTQMMLLKLSTGIGGLLMTYLILPLKVAFLSVMAFLALRMSSVFTAAAFLFRNAIMIASLAGSSIYRAAIIVGSIAGAAATKVAHIAGAIAGAGIIRSAMVAGAVAGSILMKTASVLMTASGMVFLGLIQAGALLLAAAPMVGVGLLIALLVAALVGIGAIFKDEIYAGAELFADYIKESWGYITDIGESFADSVLNGLSKLIDLGASFGAAVVNHIKEFFGGGESSRPAVASGNGSVGGDTSSKAPVKRANGGSVFGAGSATSDSIPAMLSNGEFVMKTSVASQYRPFLEHLNSTGELPKFATGGLVGGLAMNDQVQSGALSALGSIVSGNTASSFVAEAWPNMTEDNLMSLIPGDSPWQRLLGETVNKPAEWAQEVHQRTGATSMAGVKDFIQSRVIGSSLRAYQEDKLEASTLQRGLQYLEETMDIKIPQWGGIQDAPEFLWDTTNLLADVIGYGGRAANKGFRPSLLGFMESWQEYSHYEKGGAGNLFKASLVEGMKFAPEGALYGGLAGALMGVGGAGKSLLKGVGNVGKKVKNATYKKAFGKDQKGYTKPESSGASEVLKIAALLGSVSGVLVKSAAGSAIGATMYTADNALRYLVDGGVPEHGYNSTGFVTSGKPRTVKLGFDSGQEDPTQSFATGGSVFGAGSATSDSIPAMLSNGEFVMKTSVASQYRPFLEQLNSTGKLPGFSTGGTVGSSGSVVKQEEGIMSTMLTALQEMLKSLLGEENFDKVAKVLSGLRAMISKGFSSIGGGSAAASDSIFSVDELVGKLETTLSTQKIDTGVLLKELKKDASLTKRLLDLSDSRGKVQAKIFEMEKRNEKIPLQLLSQLKIIDNDLITQLGNVSAILEDVAQGIDKVIPAIAGFASKAVDSTKSDFNSGITGLLKGEIDLGEFAYGMVDSFTGSVLDTLGSSITESIFNTADGEASEFANSLESIFTDVGSFGFGLGEEGLSSVGSLFSKGDKEISASNLNLSSMPLFDMSSFTSLPGGPEGVGGETDTSIEEGFDAGALGIGKVLDGWLPGLGGMFDSLLGGLGGIFSTIVGSLSKMFSSGGGGGGGGGFDIFGTLLGAAGTMLGGGSSGGGLADIGGGISASNLNLSSMPTFDPSSWGSFNDGGMVPGGGPTPVIAHGGEMILNKRQQSNLFGDLDRSRNAQAGSQQQISINVTGDISRQTKKEIYSMMPTIASGVNQQNKEQNYR